MASMALSTVAWAVISTICGRSPARRVLDELADEIEAGQVRHDVVDDQHVERPLGQQPLRRPAAGGLHHVVAVLPQRAAQRPEDALLVVGDQDRAAGGHVIPSS